MVMIMLYAKQKKRHRCTVAFQVKFRSDWIVTMIRIRVSYGIKVRLA